MAKQQQTTQTVMYRTIYKAGCPCCLRHQTQENFSLEISGTRMFAWVEIPLLSEVFKHCEVSHDFKTMQHQEQFRVWKLSCIKTRLESSRSKFLLHHSVLGFKTYPCKNTKIKLMHLVKNFSLKISGTRMCAWVQIPHLSEFFKHCEVSHEIKTI